MEIHCLGHASYLLHSAGGTRLLFDPVIKRTHQEGLFETYPRRKIDGRAVSDVDLVLISHRHMDHFDMPSLSMLARSTPILIPADDLLGAALKAAGFTTVVKAEPWSTIKFNDLTISPTQSLVSFPECGFVLSDGVTKIWNQVDSAVSPEIVAKIMRKHRRFDLAMVQWQPLQDFLPANGGAVGFPYDNYGNIINSARELRAKRVILGACGFRYAGAYGRFNNLAFPQSRNRAIEDYNRIGGRKNDYAFAVDPGDLIALKNGRFSIRRNRSEIVRRASEWDQETFDFCPWRPEWAQRPIKRTKYSELGRKLTLLFRAWLKESKSSLSDYRKWDIIYTLRVVGENDTEDISIDFRGKQPVVHQARMTDASILCFIDKNALARLLSNEVTWDYVMLSGDMFHWHRVYRVSKTGLALPGQAQLANPLFQVLPDSDLWLRVQFRSCKSKTNPLNP